MVQVLVRANISDIPIVLCELQGSLESDATDLRGMELGNIEFGNKDTAHIYIGHHRLEGKKVKLSKPLALLRKQTTDMELDQDPNPPLPTSEISSTLNTATSGHFENNELKASETSSTYYDVAFILREKYVFSMRPELLVQEDLRGLTRI